VCKCVGVCIGVCVWVCVCVLPSANYVHWRLTSPADNSTRWQKPFFFLCVPVTWIVYVCDMTLSYVWHDSFICATRLIHMCDMTHSYVWHDSFMRLIEALCFPVGKCDMTLWILMKWLFHMCDRTHSYVWQDSFICVTWPIHMCDVTHSYVWHHSVIEAFFFPVGECDMTPRYQWNDTFIYVTGLIHIYGRTHSYVWRDPSICVRWLIYAGHRGRVISCE